MSLVGAAPHPLLPAVDAAEAAACGDDAGAACLLVHRLTGNDVVARATDWLVSTPLKVLLIVVVALVVNRVLQRVIRRFLAGLERGGSLVTLSGLPGLGGDGPASGVFDGAVDTRSLQRAETIGAVLRSLAKATIAIFATLMVLSEFGIDLGPLIAGAGIVGIAVGFGAQTLVKDFLSGVFMLIEDQFGVGDVIDAGGVSGVVEGISLRITRLRDVEGVVWHIPNGSIPKVGNKSQQWSRALLDVEVAYDTDLDEAKRIIKEVADTVWHDDEVGPSVLEEPEVWGVESFGPTGIAIRLVLKTQPADQWKVLRELRSRLKVALNVEGIQFGFQRQLWGPDGAGAGAGAAAPPPTP